MNDLALESINNSFIKKNLSRVDPAYRDARDRGVNRPVVFVVGTGFSMLDEIAARIKELSTLADTTADEVSPRSDDMIVAVEAQDAESIRDEFTMADRPLFTIEPPAAGCFVVVFLENVAGGLRPRSRQVAAPTRSKDGSWIAPPDGPDPLRHIRRRPIR